MYALVLRRLTRLILQDRASVGINDEILIRLHICFLLVQKATGDRDHLRLLRDLRLNVRRLVGVARILHRFGALSEQLIPRIWLLHVNIDSRIA